MNNDPHPLPEILNCPFCGSHGDAELIQPSYAPESHQVHCSNCGGLGGICLTAEAAINVWNRRTHIDSKPSEQIYGMSGHWVALNDILSSAEADIENIRAEKNLLRFDNERLQAEIEKLKAEIKESLKDQKFWCAYCGTWGDHQSGWCPEIDRSRKKDALNKLSDEVTREGKYFQEATAEECLEWYGIALRNCSHYTDYQDGAWLVFKSNGEGISSGKSLFEAIRAAMEAEKKGTL